MLFGVYRASTSPFCQRQRAFRPRPKSCAASRTEEKVWVLQVRASVKMGLVSGKGLEARSKRRVQRSTSGRGMGGKEEG